MPSLFLGYDVADAGRRNRIRRTANQYLHLLHKSALQGVTAAADTRLLMQETVQHLEPSTDGLLLARLHFSTSQPHLVYQLRPDASRLRPGLILLS